MAAISSRAVVTPRMEALCRRWMSLIRDQREEKFCRDSVYFINNNNLNSRYLICYTRLLL